jgi:transposase
MDSHVDSRNIGRRRRWSNEAKLRIVEECFSGPRLASATARRHGISNPLLFAWRKAYREGRLGESVGFVPAVIVREPAEKGTRLDCSRIEIVSANGRRVIVDYDVDVERLLGIIRGLEKLS